MKDHAAELYDKMRLGEAVLALVKESGLLRRKPGRKRGGRRPGRPRTAAANGAEKPKRDYAAERRRRKPRPEPLPVE